MNPQLEQLFNDLSKDKNFITGRFVNSDDAFEIFVKNIDFNVNDMMKQLREETGLKILKSELKRFTFIISIWGQNNCRTCGNPMSYTEENNQKRFFCNQCVKFN